MDASDVKRFIHKYELLRAVDRAELAAFARVPIYGYPGHLLPRALAPGFARDLAFSAYLFYLVRYTVDVTAYCNLIRFVLASNIDVAKIWS